MGRARPTSRWLAPAAASIALAAIVTPRPLWAQYDAGRHADSLHTDRNTRRSQEMLMADEVLDPFAGSGEELPGGEASPSSRDGIDHVPLDDTLEPEPAGEIDSDLGAPGLASAPLIDPWDPNNAVPLGEEGLPADAWEEEDIDWDDGWSPDDFYEDPVEW